MIIRTCSECGAKNRVAGNNLERQGRCGACKQPLPPPAEPVEVDSDTFDEVVQAAQVPVVVDFWASWCGPCKMAAPEFVSAARSCTGRALFLKVDTERQTALAGRFNVRSIPYFAVFRYGRPVWQQAGLLRAHELVALVDQHSG